MKGKAIDLLKQARERTITSRQALNAFRNIWQKEVVPQLILEGHKVTLSLYLEMRHDFMKRAGML